MSSNEIRLVQTSAENIIRTCVANIERALDGDGDLRGYLHDCIPALETAEKKLAWCDSQSQDEFFSRKADRTHGRGTA